MSKSVFDPTSQQTNLRSKIVAGLERVSEVFKVLLWEKAKLVGLSPIQIQILVFIAYHKDELCNVSHLAKEFNITKPTISDAIKVLDKKQLIIKDYSSTDNRSYTIHLSTQGKELVSRTEDFAHPLKRELDGLEEHELSNLFTTLSKLISQLNDSQILTVQRTCTACKFHEKRSGNHYCNLLRQPLRNEELRLDCPEFEAKG